MWCMLLFHAVPSQIHKGENEADKEAETHDGKHWIKMFPPGWGGATTGLTVQARPNETS